MGPALARVALVEAPGGLDGGVEVGGLARRQRDGLVRAARRVGAAAVVAASPIADGRGANDLAIQINRKDTTKGAWPLVLVSYVIACQEYKDSAKADLVKGYVDYIVSEAAQKAAAEQAGSAPLSSDLASKVSKAAATIK